MKILGEVKNGNYVMQLWSDGTKVRYNNLDYFEPESIESCDCKITNCCNMGCKMCHENSTPDGKHGDILNVPFFDTLLPYTEIAIGGGNPLSHPDLIPFLNQLKERKLIPNMTVNQRHFNENVDLLHELIDNELIYGLGVSLVDANDELLDALSEFPNAVIHVINGLISLDKLRYMAHKGLKILVLGYKEFGRGNELYKCQNTQINTLKSSFYDMLPTIIEDEWFEVVSFDNLAIDQLDPKRIMSDEKWNEFYLGDDGFATMYVDLVERQYAKSSTSNTRYNLLDDVKPMFDNIRCK